MSDDASREGVEDWKRGPLAKIEQAFFGSARQRPRPTAEAQDDTDIPAGWYAAGDGLRYWDGQRWTSQRAPAPDIEPIAKTILWAMSLAAGVAGCLAWGAPVLAYYWPLGLGGASLALAVATRELRGKVPWYGAIALIAGLVAVGIGVVGYNDIEDARRALDEFP